MFRLRTLAVILLCALSVYFLTPYLLHGMVTNRINMALAQLGYPKPHYDLTRLSWGRLVIENLQLEPEGYSTIDRIQVHFSPLSLFAGRVTDVRIDHPDFVFSDDEDGQTTTPTSLALPAISLHDLPLDTLDVQNLNLGYAGDGFTINLGGNIKILDDDSGGKQAFVNLSNASPEFSFSLKGTLTETSDRAQKIDLQIPEFRAEMENLRLSRAHANLTVHLAPNTPLSMNGEIMAGALKIGTLPLEGLSIVASGTKPDLSIIGNAGITGLPQTNISLRVSEDGKGAKLLLQLSGAAPRDLWHAFAPQTPLPLPTQQKFALAIDADDTDLWALLQPPYKAGAFLYLNDQTPVLSVAINGTNATNITAEIPPTTFNTPTLMALAGPLLSDQGIKLLNGTVTTSAKFTTTPATFTASAESNNLDLTWQGLALNAASFKMARTNDGHLQIARATTGMMGGTATIAPITIDPNFSGASTLTLNNISLTEFAKFAAVKGLDMTGTLNGTIPFRMIKGQMVAERGANITAPGGVIRYTPDSYPGFLAGDDQRMQILQQALQNYDFDTLTVDFSGDPQGSLSAALAAKGRNQKLFPNRPIHINLNIDGPLAPAIRQLIPSFGNTIQEEEAAP